MATTKRERQKQLRAQKVEQMKKVQQRKQTGRKLLVGLIVVVLLAGSAVLIFHPKSAQVATIPTTSTTTATAASCSTADSSHVSGSVAGFATIATPLPSGVFCVAPTVTVPNSAPPKVEEAYDLIKGTGPTVGIGSNFTVQYVLADYATHKVLQSSWTSSPFSSTLNYGGLITGWVKGMIGMKQGGRRELIIPPALGYGAGGNGIAANDTLVFVIDLLKVN